MRKTPKLGEEFEFYGLRVAITHDVFNVRGDSVAFALTVIPDGRTVMDLGRGLHSYSLGWPFPEKAHES